MSRTIGLILYPDTPQATTMLVQVDPPLLSDETEVDMTEPTVARTSTPTIDPLRLRALRAQMRIP